VFKTVAEATATHPQINTSLVYIGADRACAAGMEALNDPKIQLVSMITEGVPERDAKLLAQHARKLGKTFNGPSAIGIVSAGECRLGVIGGDLEERAAEWYGLKKRRIKLLAVVSGFCQESLPKGMKFWHAGAKEGLKGEGSARSKAEAFKKAGAVVPDTFDALGPAIKAVYEEQIGRAHVRPIPDMSWEDRRRLTEAVEEGTTAGS